ncbi:MAG: hypothetical protein GKS01_08295 [Alphaproteobacteria bacterium]|nr:hypothetical protein [Alphaproteobacteria bacterium]
MFSISRLSVPGRALAHLDKSAVFWRNFKAVLISKTNLVSHLLVVSVVATGCETANPPPAKDSSSLAVATSQSKMAEGTTNTAPKSSSVSTLKTSSKKKLGSLAAYRLGPGDRLKVTVFDHPRNSGEFEVDSLGSIAFPFLGRIEARGKTVAGFQEIVRTQLDQKFIVNPRVSVEVLNYRPFYIYGEVNRAGSYPYVIGLTVRRAVAIAGGFTRRARQSPVSLVRESVDGVTTLEKRLDQPVLPGDIVEIQRRLF